MSRRDEHDRIEDTVAENREWLAEIADEVRGLLVAWRERTPSSEAMHLAAQLPVLLRGLLFAGSGASPRRQQNRVQSFLDQVVAELLPARDRARAPDAVSAVLAVLGHRVIAGELRQVRARLPAEIRALWPEDLIPPAGQSPQLRRGRRTRPVRRQPPRRRNHA